MSHIILPTFEKSNIFLFLKMKCYALNTFLCKNRTCLEYKISSIFQSGEFCFRFSKWKNTIGAYFIIFKNAHFFLFLLKNSSFCYKKLSFHSKTVKKSAVGDYSIKNGHFYFHCGEKFFQKIMVILHKNFGVFFVQVVYIFNYVFRQKNNRVQKKSLYCFE